MPKFIASLLTAVLLTTSKLVLACSLFPEEPSVVFNYSESLVLAEPIEISPDPKDIGKVEGHYFFEQTVTWRVLKVWKGSLRDGETFVTTSKYDTMSPCSGWGIIHRYSPNILHSSADSSLGLYIAAHIDTAVPVFNTLKDEAEGAGR